MQVGTGLLVGIGLVVGADRLIADYEFQPRKIPDAGFRKLVLIVGVLTVHSFPEGVALGVAFADLEIEGDLFLAGLAVPSLAIFITIAISIQNIPEGLAVAIPLHTYGLSPWKNIRLGRVLEHSATDRRGTRIRVRHGGAGVLAVRFRLRRWRDDLSRASRHLSRSPLARERIAWPRSARTCDRDRSGGCDHDPGHARNGVTGPTDGVTE